MASAKKKPSKPSRAVAVRAPSAPATRGEITARTLQELASDKSVDVAKYQAFLAMHKQALDDKRKSNFGVAMKKAQAKIRAVIADKNNKETKSNYASFPALDRMVRPICGECDLVVEFDTEDVATPLTVRVVAFVTHTVEGDDETGFTRKYHVDMPADGKGAKGGDVMTRTHATGSAITYGKRYLYIMAFNIPVVSAAAKREDDDGNAAGFEAVTDEQATAIINKLEEVGCKKEHFLAKAGVATIGALRADQYGRAMAFLEAYGREHGGKR